MFAFKSVVIANAATVSSAIELARDERPVMIETPAALTGTAITFQGSIDGTTYVPVYEVGGANAYSVTVGTSRAVALDHRVFAGINYLKLVSGSTEAAERTIKVVLRPVAL